MDKAFSVLNAVVERPMTLSEVVAATKLPRATAHRLLLALEVHGAIRRNGDGCYCIGLSMVGLANAASHQFPLIERAQSAAEELRDATGESV